MNAHYWIAQHIDDVFRMEPRNIGVVARLGDVIGARFFGELENGQIDGRKLRHAFDYPDVYRQWIEFWREEVRAKNIERLPEEGGSNFRIIDGGTVDDVSPNDTIHDVLTFLYSWLISEGGIRSAIGIAETEQTASAQLSSEIVKVFSEHNLLAADDDVLVPHPIRASVPVTGVNAEYRPAFLQENGLLWVMETVDFTIRAKRQSRDHAGWSAYMFKDIRSKRGDRISPISIVRYTESDQAEEEVRNGLAVLRSESQVINWLDDGVRLSFLAERDAVARS
jgi:hypothetical protein